jgi:uncharacterized protein YndB with AHSA1/START domain
MTDLDRLEKQLFLRASRARVFRALTDSQEFGTWFLARFDGPFVEGRQVHGQILYPGYEHMRFILDVERIEPERYFAFRWHPYAVDDKVDYSKEPTTLVEFTLNEVANGIELQIVESGFSRLPPERRDEAFRKNEEGWTEQLRNIERHVAQA